MKLKSEGVPWYYCLHDSALMIYWNWIYVLWILNIQMIFPVRAVTDRELSLVFLTSHLKSSAVLWHRRAAASTRRASSSCLWSCSPSPQARTPLKSDVRTPSTAPAMVPPRSQAPPAVLVPGRRGSSTACSSDVPHFRCTCQRSSSSQDHLRGCLISEAKF